MTKSLPVVGPPAEVLCVTCARTRRTCCQVTEIYVTPGDRRRIAAHTGREDFWSFRVPVTAKYFEGEADDPMWFACTARADRSRAMLHRTETLDCTFLGANGCTLPMETRPLVCRMYPFDYNERGLLPALDVSYCPTELLAPGRDMVSELGMQRADAERWHATLYAEIQDEPHSRWDAVRRVVADGSRS